MFAPHPDDETLGAGGLLALMLVVASAAMDALDVDELELCPWALREGVILRRLDWLDGA